MKTTKPESDNWAGRIALATRLTALSIGILTSLASELDAQTLVSGSISGTWSPSGNPYVLTDNATVPSGQTLTIQPGTIVWIGSNLTMTVNGTISAIGTPSQRVTFQAPGTASYYWNEISLIDPPGTTNCFHYCDFKNAQTAISVTINNNTGYYLAGAEMYNCTFSNCSSQAFYGNCGANVGLNPTIKNCMFSDTSNGCVMIIWYNGHSNPTISGNIFQNLSGTAFLLTVGDNRYSGGQPKFFNNTVVGCYGGVNAADPWDVTVENNIFSGITNACQVSGSLSRANGYNCFYQNATNFTGYPGTYGQVLLNNRNGTPCDILYSIFQNPLFAAANDFHLQATSPCVNAGVAGQAFANLCFPPSVGTNYNDMGAYGGPDAANWLDTVPLVPAQWLSLTKTNTTFWLSWFDVPRSMYQIEYATNLVGTNIWRTNTLFTASGTPSVLSVATYSPTNQPRFYRIRSLGRTPGN